MSKIKVTQQIEVIEKDDTEIPIDKELYLGINSHWNFDDWIVLTIGKQKYTVNGDNLIEAIRNAMNTGN